MSEDNYTYSNAKVTKPKITILQAQTGGEIFNIFVNDAYYSEVEYFSIRVKQEDLQRTIDILNEIFGKLKRGIKKKDFDIVLVAFDKEIKK